MQQTAQMSLDNLAYFVRRMNELGLVTLTEDGERLLIPERRPELCEEEYACYS